jgi:hypothetical protein
VRRKGSGGKEIVVERKMPEVCGKSDEELVYQMMMMKRMLGHMIAEELLEGDWIEWGIGEGKVMEGKVRIYIPDHKREG